MFRFKLSWDVSPEQCVVVKLFCWLAAIPVSFRNEPIIPLETFCPFGNNGNTLPHPLPQAFPPLVCNHTNHTHREAGRWGAVGIAYGQAGENPDVPRAQQTHLSCLTEQVLRLVVRAVRQQDLGVHLQTERVYAGIQRTELCCFPEAKNTRCSEFKLKVLLKYFKRLNLAEYLQPV